MARASLPPGFRFHPTDIELVMYHLKRKVMGKNVKFEVISELYIYKFSPWDLPDKSCLGSKDLEWYFFCPKETKYANGARMNRATDCGYWKSTGKDRCVSHNDRTVAMVKTLVFHTGHPPKGERTDWVMHEYRMVDKELADAGVVQDAYMLCKVFHKSGPGPKNGAQYGAPFNEDDYDDDGEICAESSLPVALPPPTLASNNSLGGSVYCPGSTSSWISSDSVSVPGSTSIGPLSDPGPSKDMLCDDELPPDMFIVDNLLHSCENGNSEAENFGHVTRNEGSACLDGNDIYSDLEDLKTTGFGFTPMLAGNDLDFLELIDLDSQLDPALNQSPLQSPLSSDSLIKWDPPPAEATKLNTGGYQSNGKAGFGGLFRSKEGVWLLGFYGKVECNSSLETELWGIYRGLTIILEKGMANITIETDSQEAVKLITGGPDPSCPCRVLVDESHRLMNRTGSSLYHIYREANECAEQLARFGAEQDKHLLVYEF